MARFKIEYCCSKKEYSEAKHLIQEKYGIEYDPFNSTDVEIPENLTSLSSIDDDIKRKILNGSMLQSFYQYWACQKENTCGGGTGRQYTAGGIIYFEQPLKITL